MIDVKNLDHFIGKNHILKNLNFTIEAGETVGFIGRNGAGKSTTMRMMTGYLQPSRGTVRVNGIDVASQTLQAQKIIGYLPEANPLYTQLTVIDSILFIAKLHGLEKTTLEIQLKKVIEACSLQNVLAKKIENLSKGFKQRVGLAQTLIHNPDVFILDEPTVGLDPYQIKDFRQVITSMQKDKTILISTHILSEVETICQRVIIIERGQIVANEKMSDITQTQNLEAAFFQATQAKD